VLKDAFGSIVSEAKGYATVETDGEEWKQCMPDVLVMGRAKVCCLWTIRGSVKKF